MNSPILLNLKERLNELTEFSEVGVETKMYALKEELQFYVLDFIYHNPKYSDWTMYGGSALRICHGLNRMSVDLDFEINHKVTKVFLNTLKNEIETHFEKAYALDTELLTVKTVGTRGLRLNFHILDKLGLDYRRSRQVHVKLDLNNFTAPKTIKENRTINKDQLSFVLNTYNMSALMASKLAAIFLREERIVGHNKYDYKGRDIYDLLWYMNKRIIPDFDYLKAKKIDIKDPKTLFDEITKKILNYEKMDELLKKDLDNLFERPGIAENWLKNWRTEYLNLLKKYEINRITNLRGIEIFHEFNRYYFIYQYNTKEGGEVEIKYVISDYWFDFIEGDLQIKVDEKIQKTAKFHGNGISNKRKSAERLLQYATLFYKMTNRYFKKMNGIMVGDTITTKLIRMTTDKFNPKEQILLNKSALLSCELDDLLR